MVEHNTLTSTALNVQSAMPTAAPTAVNLAYVLNNTNGKAVLIATGTGAITDWVVVASQPTNTTGDPRGNITPFFEMQQIVDTAEDPPKLYYALSTEGNLVWTPSVAESAGSSGPYAIPGTPEFWISAEAGVTTTGVAGVITEILDQSSSSNNLTYSGSIPTLSDAAFNGLDGFYFDGNLTSGGRPITTTSSTDWTIIFVGACLEGALFMMNGDSAAKEIVMDGTNNRVYLTGFTGGQINTPAPPETAINDQNATLSVISIVINSAGVAFFQNGQSWHTASFLGSAFSWENVFTFMDGTGSPSADVTDFLVWPTELSTSDRQSAENTLIARYAL